MTASRVFLVTGASGFVGRELCGRLTGHGRVRALLRRTTDGPWDESVCVDLTSTSTLTRAVRGVDTVCHLAGKTDDSKTAAKESGEFFRVNFDGTARLLETAAASGVERFVYLSSIKAMGAGGEERLDERSPPRPTTPYGKSKRAAEELVLGSGDIPHVCVIRSSPVYGVGSKGNLTRMIRAMSRGVFPPIPDTHNARSMVHVEDVAQALILSIEKTEANGRVFIVTDGRVYSTRQIYEWVSKAMGRKIPSWTIPLSLLRAVARVGDGLGALTGRGFGVNSIMLDRLFGSAHYDSTRIHDALGFRPRWDLERAIPDLVSSVTSSAKP